MDPSPLPPTARLNIPWTTPSTPFETIFVMSGATTPDLLEEDDLAVDLPAEAVGLVVKIADSIGSRISTNMKMLSDTLRKSQPLPVPMIMVTEQREVEREYEEEYRLDCLYEVHMPKRYTELGTRQVMRAHIGKGNGRLEFSHMD
jgi:hypothetical protein